jgi:hypothetical protein
MAAGVQQLERIRDLMVSVAHWAHILDLRLRLARSFPVAADAALAADHLP